MEKPAEKPTEKTAEQAREKTPDKDKLDEVRPLLEALARAIRRREAPDGQGEEYTTTKLPWSFQGVTDGWGEVPRALRAIFRFERTLIYGAAGLGTIASHLPTVRQVQHSGEVHSDGTGCTAYCEAQSGERAPYGEILVMLFADREFWRRSAGDGSHLVGVVVARIRGGRVLHRQ